MRTVFFKENIKILKYLNAEKSKTKNKFRSQCIGTMLTILPKFVGRINKNVQ